MPADNPPRKITLIKAPYNYEWPDRSAVTCFRETGEVMVRAEVADHAVRNGYAIEGWATGSRTRSNKGKTSRRRSAKSKADAGADIRSHEAMGGTDLAADDRAGAGQPLADAAD